MLSIALQIIAAWLFAELISGHVHWWEDRYGDPTWPVLGPLVILPNIEHHEHPAAFVQRDYWTRNYTALVPCLVAAICSWHTPWLCLGFLFLSQSNELHAWAHMRCSRPIRWLQRLGVLQSPRHHAYHHTRPFSSQYCVMSNWVNPVLEVTRYWRLLEGLVWCLCGAVPHAERREA